MLLGLAVVSSVAMADHHRSITDLMYFPGAGTWNSTTELTMSTTKTGAAASATVTETESNFINQEVGYSLKDNSRVTVDFDYYIDREDSTVGSSTAAIDNYESGVQTLTLGYRHRFNVKKHSNLDVFFNYSPSLGDAKTASATVEGNNMAGGDSYDLGVEYGCSHGKMSYAAGLTFTNNGEVDTEGTNGVVHTTNNERNDVALNLGIQYDFKKNLFFRGELDYVSLGNVNTPAYSSNSQTATEVDDYFNWGLTVGYTLGNDNSLLTLKLENANVEYALLPSSAANEYKSHAHSATFGYTRQF